MNKKKSARVYTADFISNIMTSQAIIVNRVYERRGDIQFVLFKKLSCFTRLKHAIIYLRCWLWLFELSTKKECSP